MGEPSVLIIHRLLKKQVCLVRGAWSVKVQARRLKNAVKMRYIEQTAEFKCLCY